MLEHAPESQKIGDEECHSNLEGSVNQDSRTIFYGLKKVNTLFCRTMERNVFAVPAIKEGRNHSGRSA